MLSLYLVRHGQTDYSRENRFCGSIDPPLNATGMAMATALAARLGGERWEAIYASPLLRTRQTAQPTATRAGVPLLVEEGLREIAYGEWEGRAESEVERDDAERFRAWSGRPGWVAPPGGETGFEVAVRAQIAVRRIQSEHGQGKVLVFSHKATLRVLLCALLGIDIDLFRVRVAQRVGALNIVDFTAGGPQLRTLGDVSHLSPELLAGDGT
jgi:probable phosphoglycerate mutase